MRLQTRMSGLLFFLLLGLCAGSALVVRDSLHEAFHLHQEQLKHLSSQESLDRAHQLAGLALEVLREEYEDDREALMSHVETLATLPVVQGTLTRTSLGTQRSFWRPDKLTSPHQIGVLPEKGSLRFQTLLGSEGQVLSNLAILDLTSASKRSAQQTSAKRNSSRRGGVQRVIRPPRRKAGAHNRRSGTALESSAGVVSPEYSLLNAREAEVAPLKALVQEALRGIPVVSLERVPETLLQRLNAVPGAPTRDPRSSLDSTLLLVACRPIVDHEGTVLGAILAGTELTREPTLLQRWQNTLHLEGAGAALIVDGRRQNTLGKGPQENSVLEEALWTSLSAQKMQVTVQENRVFAHVALVNHQGDPLAALEVSIQRHETSVQALMDAALSNHEDLFQNKLSLIGILGIIALVVGILVSRGFISAPIRRLVYHAEQVSTGQLDATFKNLTGQDELGSLARSLERMRVSLKKMMERQQG